MPERPPLGPRAHDERGVAEAHDSELVLADVADPRAISIRGTSGFPATRLPSIPRVPDEIDAMLIAYLLDIEVAESPE